jgi:hypothetical protein
MKQYSSYQSLDKRFPREVFRAPRKRPDAETRPAIRQTSSMAPSASGHRAAKPRAASHFCHDFNQNRPANCRVPNAPINEFEDCPTDWQSEANNALVLARAWVANVVAGLSSLTYPFPAPVATLLNRHFRITVRGYLYEVRRHYNTINAAINSPIDFECETSCGDNVAAYVYSIWTDVHLCPIWHGLSTVEQANTIIHEIAHDAADRDDEAYYWEAGYSKLSVEDAIDNADSYSYFAQEAYYGP